MKKKNSPPAKNRNENAQVLRHVTETFSGPLPHPRILEQYNQVANNAAERILKMAENESAHRQRMETSALEGAVSRDKRGQIFGLVIGISAFITTIVALALGSEITASVVGGATVTGLVAVFVTGRIYEQKEPFPPTDNNNSSARPASQF